MLLGEGYEVSHSRGRLLVERSWLARQFSEVIARSDFDGHPHEHTGGVIIEPITRAVVFREAKAAVAGRLRVFAKRPIVVLVLDMRLGSLGSVTFLLLTYFTP